MAFMIHEQYIDVNSGFHVIKLRGTGGVEHVVQLSVGADSCPMCGVAYPKDNLGAIDPKAMANSVIESLNTSSNNVAAYAKKHCVRVK
jgi:hypothetical protein